MSLDPGTIFAGHRIEAVAGSGGMGIVYRATQLALDITVALKVMAPELADDQDFRARFQRETKLAAMVDHPNLIPVRHAGEEGGLLYVTMRYVEGTDLRRMIDEESPLDPVLVATVISQVAGGLAAAHAEGLVHRDVKPANILIERTGRATKAYLTDFGLTRRSASTEQLTKTGSLLGTLDYVAPEQIQGTEIDGRADIYALGCTLFQALTGRPPFTVEGEVPKIFAHLNEPPPSAIELRPDLAPAIDPVIARAMAKDREDRYRSALDFARELDEAVGRQRSAAEATTVSAAPPPGVPTETQPPSETREAVRPAPGEGTREVAGPTQAAETRAAETRAAEIPKAGDVPTAAAPPAAVDREARAAPPSPGERRRLLRWLLAAGGVAAIAVLAVILLGGGGDEGANGGVDRQADDGNRQVAGLTPAAFREQADAICTDIERRVEEESARGYDQADFLPIRADIVEDGVGQLRELEPPSGVDAAKYRRYIETRAEFAAGLRELGAAMAAGSPDVEQLIARNERLAREKMAIGRQLDLKACADVLPQGDREEVEALGADWLTGADADQICADRVTSTYLDAQFAGDESNCAASPPVASQATLTDLFGVEGVHATATYATDSGEAQVEADFEDGTWKVDAVKPAA